MNTVCIGDVDPGMPPYAEEKIGRLCSLGHTPVLGVEVKLTQPPHQSQSAVAEATIDLNGTPIRAHVGAASMHEAIDRLEARMRHRLERHKGVLEARRRRNRKPEDHEWRRGDFAKPAPSYYDRPVGEREVVRHKTFAIEPVTPEDAAWDMDMLDHSFYLFVDKASGTDRVIASRDGRYEVSPAVEGEELPGDTDPAIYPGHLVPSPMPLGDALDVLDAGLEPFVFHRDPDTGRTRVLYRRYDGHYGLITPADEPG